MLHDHSNVFEGIRTVLTGLFRGGVMAKIIRIL